MMTTFGNKIQHATSGEVMVPPAPNATDDGMVVVAVVVTGDANSRGVSRVSRDPRGLSMIYF